MKCVPNQAKKSTQIDRPSDIDGQRRVDNSSNNENNDNTVQSCCHLAYPNIVHESVTACAILWHRTP